MRIFVFFVVFFFSFQASGQEYLTTTGEVTFLSIAPLNEFDGKSNALNGLVNLDSNILDFFVDLNTLKTGIGLRDSHMRESYLETDQFPFAEFTGKIVQIPILVIGEKIPVKAFGTFKIHGEKKEITVVGTLVKQQNGKITLDATFTIALSDYKIPLPSLVFYELAQEQKVTIHAVLTQKK